MSMIIFSMIIFVYIHIYIYVIMCVFIFQEQTQISSYLLPPGVFLNVKYDISMSIFLIHIFINQVCMFT